MKKARSNHKPSYRLHPVARALIEGRSRDGWALTEDGLICAPVGFYRLLELDEGDEYSDPVKRIVPVFGFYPQDLALVPHPTDPKRKILQKTAYVLKPVDPAFWSLDRLKSNQDDWMDFVCNYGNLYAEREGEAVLLSNKLATYLISPHSASDGNRTGYSVDLHINPHSHHYHADLVREGRLRFSIMLAKNVAGENPDEALRFALEDYRYRFHSNYFKGDGPFRLSDPQKLRGLAMRARNRLTEVRGKPLSVWNALVSALFLVATRLRPTGFVNELGGKSFEENVKEEEDRSALHKVAEVSENSIVPLDEMKEEARLKCVAIDPSCVRSQLLPGLPRCGSLSDLHRVRILDAVHGLEPSIIEANADASRLTIRSHRGIEIHKLGPDQFCITYGQKKQRTIPRRFRRFFAAGKIARIRIVSVEEKARGGESDLSFLPHDPFKKAVVAYLPAEEIRKEFPDHPFIQKALERHRDPVIEPKADKKAERSFRHVKEKRSAFRRCAHEVGRAVRHYAPLVLPMRGRNKKDGYYSLGCLGFGLASAWNWVAPVVETVGFAEYTQLFEKAAPAAIVLGAGFMARRMAANALTERGRRVWRVVSGAGLAGGSGLFGWSMGKEITDSALESKVDKELLDETIGLAVSVGYFLKHGWQLCRDIRTYRPHLLSHNP
jgi:hypothetical protein